AARGQFQVPTHELLVYPLTNNFYSTTSANIYTSASLPLNTPTVIYFAKLYAGNADPNDPGLLPIYANLAGLPPTTILAAEFDPLLGDGQLLAQKMTQQGTSVDYQMYTGVTHEFFGMGAYVAKAKTAEMYGASKLAASFK
ncbi:MAG: alpha/beta hydrolase fold domain-containing protein, partial [Janthinobacterium lividum]